MDQGRIDDAGALFRDALRAWQPSGMRIAIAFAKRNLGRVACWTGRGDDARTLLQESLEEMQAVGAKADGLETQARIAEAALVFGDAPTALALADQVLAGARVLGMDAALRPLLHRVRGAAFARAGDLEAAAGALAQSVDAARARQADYEIALGLHAQARLAEAAGGTAPATLLDESTEIFERVGVIAIPDLFGSEPAAYLYRSPSSGGSVIVSSTSPAFVFVIDLTHGGVPPTALQSGRRNGVPIGCTTPPG